MFKKPCFIFAILAFVIFVTSIMLISYFKVPLNFSSSGISGSTGLEAIDDHISRWTDGSSMYPEANLLPLANLVQPYFETSLKPMGKLNRNNHILYPEDASSYIMPGNAVVKWYAENTVLTDTELVWKHNNSPVAFIYMTDSDLFENPQDDDMWQNPDYYLTHGNIGDCEDFSLAFASIIEAKNISAEIFGVRLVNGQYHWIVRYDFNGHTRYADINRNSVIIYQDFDPKIDKEWVAISTDSIKTQF